MLVKSHEAAAELSRFARAPNATEQSLKAELPVVKRALAWEQCTGAILPVEIALAANKTRVSNS